MELSNKTIAAIITTFQATWCDVDRRELFDAKFSSSLTPPMPGSCTFDNSRARQRQYSLCWHEMLPPLLSALEFSERAGPKHRDRITAGTIFSFGIGSPGWTPPMLRHIFPQRHIYGFDSFVGVPDEDHDASRMKGWSRGRMNGGLIGLTPAKLAARVPGGNESFTVVPGFRTQFLLFKF